jgi:zinc transport system permease protein
MWEALQMDFMRNAVVASVLLSILCGIVGTYIVVNRIAFISGGIAHAAYGGVGLSLYAGMPVPFGTGLFALGTGLLIGLLSLRERGRADAIIGVIWALGMALGILFLDLTPGYRGDILGYLFGNILLVSKADTYFLLAIDVIAVGIVAKFYKEFMAISFDKDFATVIGIPTKFLYLLLISMISVSIIAIIKIVGLLLVVALLTIPPYVAERFASSMGKMMTLSCLCTMLFCIAGLQVSYRFNLPPSACIIFVAAFFFFISRLIK